MKIFISLSLLFFLYVIPSSLALQFGDGLYFSIPPESVQCVQIRLPDDAGVYVPGYFEYSVTSNSPWGDLSEVRVQTDENNSVKVPFCIRTFGKLLGQCSSSSVSISSPEAGIGRSFSGGVCVSNFSDVDYAPHSSGNPMQILNDHADIFDVSFSKGAYTLTPDLKATLLLESYESITLELEARGLEPAQMTVLVSGSVQVNFTPTGTGPISVIARISGCSQPYCEKLASSMVLDTGQSSGYSVFLFPVSLDVREIQPVHYELYITNYGQEKQFSVQLLLPQGLESTFQPQSVSVRGERKIEFDITPVTPTSDVRIRGETFPASLYQLTAVVSSEGVSKEASATLSTNELLTDAMRTAEYAVEHNISSATEAGQALDSWYNSYNSGLDLQAYQDFRNQVNSSAPNPPDNPPGPGPAPEPLEPSPPFNFLYIAIPLIAVAVVAVLFLRSRQQKGMEVPEF